MDGTRRSRGRYCAPPTLLDVARSCAAYAFVLCYGSVVFLPATALGALLRCSGLMMSTGLTGLRVALRVAGLQYAIDGREHLPADRGAVYCINHSSYLDLLVFVILYPVVPRLRVLYKREFAALPLLGTIFALAGFIPIDRSRHEHAMSSLKQAAETLKRGFSLLTAPEGTRSRDGRLQSFKKGVFVLAIEAQVPIVPIGVAGALAALPPGCFIVRKTCIRVRIGTPIETVGMTYDDRDTLRSLVATRIASLMAPDSGP